MESPAKAKAKVVVAGALDLGGKLMTAFSVHQDLKKMSEGSVKIRKGEVAQGLIDIGEGGGGLALTGIELSAASTGAVAGLSVAAAGGSVSLAADTLRAAHKGEDTPVETAEKFYGVNITGSPITAFVLGGPIYGMMFYQATHGR
jgi:hypothetical protein